MQFSYSTPCRSLAHSSKANLDTSFLAPFHLVPSGCSSLFPCGDIGFGRHMYTSASPVARMEFMISKKLSLITSWSVKMKVTSCRDRGFYPKGEKGIRIHPKTICFRKEHSWKSTASLSLSLSLPIQTPSALGKKIVPREWPHIAESSGIWTEIFLFKKKCRLVLLTGPLIELLQVLSRAFPDRRQRGLTLPTNMGLAQRRKITFFLERCFVHFHVGRVFEKAMSSHTFWKIVLSNLH